MTRIQLRHDTAAKWTEVNPVLAPGEIGVETNTGKFKVGDGATAWKVLKYSTDANAEALVAEIDRAEKAEGERPKVEDVALVNTYGTASNSDATTDSSKEINRKVEVEQTRAKLAEMNLFYPEHQLLMPKIEVFKNNAEEAREELQTFGERFAREIASVTYALTSGSPVGCSMVLEAGKTINGVGFYLLEVDTLRTHFWVSILNAEQKKVAESADYTSLVTNPLPKNTGRGLKVTAPYTAGGGDELIYVFLNWTGTGTPVSLACKECAAALSGLKPMAGCTATAGGATTPAKFGEGGAKVEITQASKIPWLTIF